MLFTYPVFKKFLCFIDTGHIKPLKDFKSKTVLVYVLGGITYAEVAALRLLQTLNGLFVLFFFFKCLRHLSDYKFLKERTEKTISRYLPAY